MSEVVAVDVSPVVDEDPTVGVLDAESDYDFLTDLWVGMALSLMVLSFVGCICTCFLYHSFKQWHSQVQEARRMEGQMEGGYDTESLPSYTVAAGLPSYEEAIEQLKQGAQLPGTNEASPSDVNGHTPVFSRLSVGDLLNIYKVDGKK